ncbi:hypothetical protein RE6C_01045 [Rhodopirellula europaea 6C]|uniref:Uncharacterized protein n=2 Tax=Rhodopirellula TaxID=265488 RepID=M2A8K5_9BACT|nr:hypothetical protein RBSWK_04579 [Rhodopirellula baltica SWK14]EMB18236.1 hypothetical protein RE6C_01045 [Rhodopirellula europaea 6C]
MRHGFIIGHSSSAFLREAGELLRLLSGEFNEQRGFRHTRWESYR